MDKNFQPTELGRLLNPDDFSVINSKGPLSLSITSKTYKLYVEKESFILTLDHRNDGTRFLKFSPNAEETSFLFFENQDISKPTTEEVLQSNSFYFKQKLHLLSLTSKSLGLFFFDTKSIKLLNSHAGNIESGIKFTNSPFWTEGDDKGLKIFNGFKNNVNRELKDEKKFFSILKKGSIGLWGISNNEILKMEIGAINKVDIIKPVTSISNVFGFPTWYPGYYTLESSLNRTYFRTQFNTNTMNHIKGISSTNAIERIRMKKRYLKNSVLKKRMKLETSYKKEDYYILGYYDKKEKIYTLMKFDN